MLGTVLDGGRLLDKKGGLVQDGYAFSQVKTYDRRDIKANGLRVKEWDYYCFCDDEYAVALTVADNSYMALASVSVLDFTHLKFVTQSKIALMTCGRLKMPSDISGGDVAMKKGGARLDFRLGDDGVRNISATYTKFDGKKDFACEFTVDRAAGDNITVAVPFAKKKQFYYNTKVNCLRCNGVFTVGGVEHEFKNAYGVLDWGRGVWSYKNRWFWSSLSCDVDGVDFGLNLGYGFGTPTATENTVFYGGKAHKLDNVEFDIPFTNGAPDYLKPWKLRDDAGRLDVIFYPLIDRTDKMRVLFLMTDQHQVFGKFYGRATLDDGRIISFGNKIGFAECVKNCW